MGDNTSGQGTNLRESPLFFEGEAEDTWHQKIELDKLKRPKRTPHMVKTITKLLAVVGGRIRQANLMPRQLEKLQKPAGTNLKERKKMEKLKTSMAWVYGETTVWSIFVIINVLAGMSMIGYIKLTHEQTVWVGRLAIAFGMMAFFYLTYLASKHRGTK